MRLLEAILKYAAEKHQGQFRKDGIEPYIHHPLRVAGLVAEYGGNVAQQCAGLLHDVVEDTGTSLDELAIDVENRLQPYVPQSDVRDKMVDAIIKHVDDLTCKFTKESHPQLNRAKRKELEIKEFMKLADEGSKVVKLADIIDNLSAIEKLDPDFAMTYLCEDFRIIRALKIDHPIYTKAVQVFKEAVEKML